MSDGPAGPGPRVGPRGSWLPALAVLVGLVGLAPVALVAVFIARDAVDVPYWDDWAGWISRWAHDDLPAGRLGPFWQLKNEHRVFVPQLLATALGYLTDGDMRVPVWTKLALTGVTWLLLTRLFRVHAGRAAAALVAIPFSALLFSLAQWPRWIDTRPLPSTLAILGLVGALLAATGGPRHRGRLALAVACAVLSSLSYFAGNVTWLVVGVALWCVGYRRLSDAIGFLVPALAVLVSYAVDFSNSWSLTRETAMPGLRQLVDFFFVFLGSPVVGAAREGPQSQAFAMGVFGVVAVLALTVALWRSADGGLRAALPWLAIIAWVLINDAAAAYGRAATGGIGLARVPRYTVFSTLFWIGVTALAAQLLCAAPRAGTGAGTAGRRPVVDTLLRRALPLLVAAPLALGFVSSSVTAMTSETSARFLDKLRAGSQCLRASDDPSDECLELVAPHVELTRALLPELHRRNASFLRGEG